MSQGYLIVNIDKKEKIDEYSVPDIISDIDDYYGTELYEIAWFFDPLTFVLDILLSKQWFNNKVIVIGDGYNHNNINYETCNSYRRVNKNEIDIDTNKIYVPTRLPNRQQIMINWYRNKILVNFDKKAYIDLSKYLAVLTLKNQLKNQEPPHPTVLMLVLGNENDRDDYEETEKHSIGGWAFDRVGIANREVLKAEFCHLKEKNCLFHTHRQKPKSYCYIV